jgi:hypothetical protein
MGAPLGNQNATKHGLFANGADPRPGWRSSTKAIRLMRKIAWEELSGARNRPPVIYYWRWRTFRRKYRAEERAHNKSLHQYVAKGQVREYTIALARRDVLRFVLARPNCFYWEKDLRRRLCEAAVALEYAEWPVTAVEDVPQEAAYALAWDSHCALLFCEKWPFKFRGRKPREVNEIPPAMMKEVVKRMRALGLLPTEN